MPKGVGGTFAQHMYGGATSYISASETIAGTSPYIDPSGSNGLAAINVGEAVRGGAGFVPNRVLVDTLSAQGHWYFADTAARDREVLFGGPIPRGAVRLIGR